MDLLFAHWDDHSPILGGDADAGTAADEASPVERIPSTVLADITNDANSLPAQGWGVVAPRGAVGDRLVSLVRELIDARRGEAEGNTLEIRIEPGMNADDATAWNKHEYPELYDEDDHRRPRYLLILGDLDQVSLATQQVLARDGLTGRLAFAPGDDDGYASYVDKVLRWRRSPSPRETARARALFYTVHDGTAATISGHTKLIQPCHARCARTAQERPREFPANAVEMHGADTPDRDELMALAAAEHPSVLLSMSHGMGPPRRRKWSPAEARALQGAMSFGAEGVLTGEDVASARFLPGGLWLYFACFGAGTPRISAYHHWLEALEGSGMDGLGQIKTALRGLDDGGGFVSGLAKAALANPNGPLAVLGHIDLAWSYSYEELRVADDGRRLAGSNRSRNFYQLIAKLIAGERAGAASLALKLVIDSVSAELNAHYDRCERERTAQDATTADALALGNLWMLHQDLLGYMLLGDPAVQLPIAKANEVTPRPATLSARVVHVRASEPDVPDVADLPDVAIGTDELDRWEQAACKLALDESPGVLADDLGAARSEVTEAAKVYREAGRAALAALLRRYHDEKGTAG